MFLVFIHLAVPGAQLSYTGSLVVVCKLLVMAHGIQFPGQRSNLGPQHWVLTVWVTGPPRKSQELFCFVLFTSIPLHPVFFVCLSFNLKPFPLRGLPLPSRQSFYFKAPFTSSFLKFTGIIINWLLPLLLHMVNSMMKRDFSKFLEYQIPFNLDKYGVVDTQQVLWIFLFAEWMNGWINWTELNWNYNLLHCKLKLRRVRIHMGSTKSLCSRS